MTNLEESATQVVRLCLFLENKKQIIKREYIKQHVMDKNGISMSQFESLMELTTEKLKKTFGFTLQKVPKRTGPSSYILVNDNAKAFYDCIKAYDESRKGLDELGLLSMTLCVIAVAENKLNERELMKIYSKFGVSPNSPHPVFSDINVLLTKWIRDSYLEKSKGSAVVDEPYYSWGVRAIVEFPLSDAAQTISKILGGSESEHVLKHLERIFKE